MRIWPLYASIQERRRPEEVAQLCLDLGSWNSKQRAALEKAARGAHTRGGNFGWSSMSEEFAKPVGIAAQLPYAARLFPDVTPIPASQSDDAPLVADYLRRLGAAIGKGWGQNDFKAHRLAHGARRDQGANDSRRQYNKRFRLVARLESKHATLQREWRKYEFSRIGKTRLVTRLSPEEFARDEQSAFFMAYYAARCNLRSVFTNGSQERPFDEIAEVLLEACRGRSETNWFAIAHLFPDAEVLSHLSDAQKGELLGAWYAALRDIGELLREVWSGSNLNFETMIVARGNDSTTWNNTASAWNKARDGWLATLDALGMDEVLDALCPGKVLRLMAADVAFWHRASGGTIHPDTLVWNQLPFPWEVLRGDKACGRALVEMVCSQHGVDAEKNGWSHPRPRAEATPFRPTPELVHGVEVGHPLLAKIFRDAGFFSGKAKPSPSSKSALN